MVCEFKRIKFEYQNSNGVKNEFEYQNSNGDGK